MQFRRERVWLLLITLAAAGILGGCGGPQAAAPPAAPGITPAGNRAAMIQWHQQHDKAGAQR